MAGLSGKQIKRAADRLTGTYKTYSPLISRKKQRKFEEQQRQSEEGLVTAAGDEETFSDRAEFLRQRLVDFGFIKEQDTTLADEAKKVEQEGLVPKAKPQKQLRPEDVDKFVQLRPESVPKIEYGRQEAVAYVASRFPSVYGVIFKVMSEIRRRLPDFKPARMLDYGTGPGTGIWAAHHVFGDDIREFIGVDLSEHMLKVAEDLNYDQLNHKILNAKFQSYLPARKVCASSPLPAVPSLMNLSDSHHILSSPRPLILCCRRTA